jgi:hypothetical protein
MEFPRSSRRGSFFGLIVAESRLVWDKPPARTSLIRKVACRDFKQRIVRLHFDSADNFLIVVMTGEAVPFIAAVSLFLKIASDGTIFLISIHL